MTREVDINGYNWGVRFVKRDNEELDGAWGICLNYKQEIFVCKELHPQLVKECLIHELTHAWLMTQGRGGKITMTTENICEFMGFCAEKIVKTAEELYDDWLKSGL